MIDGGKDDYEWIIMGFSIEELSDLDPDPDPDPIRPNYHWEKSLIIKNIIILLN